METKRVLSYGAVCLALLLSVGVAGADPLYNPNPIVVPDRKNLDRVKADVHRALLDKDWQVNHLGTGRLEAKRVDTGKGDKVYVAVIDVKYDAKTVTITYKDSKGLNYNKEKNEIDSKYTYWVRKLEKEIRKRFESY